MSAAGYSKYMSMIGASARMADVMSRPLRLLNSPYLVLALSYVVGQLMNIFIPSASGLALLLMVTMYPVLVKLGVSPLSAAALIATSGCLDLGPASGNANLAAKFGGMDTMTYFVDYQIPISLVVAATIAVLHYFTQRWFDKKDGEKAWQIDGGNAHEDIDFKGAPAFYMVLPMIPLILLFVFTNSSSPASSLTSRLPCSCPLRSPSSWNASGIPRKKSSTKRSNSSTPWANSLPAS